MTTRASLLRWLKFNTVGGIGIVVQLATLSVFISAVEMHYLLATVLAVEAAVLHNFLWHERFTWSDRRSATGAQIAVRLVRFNLSNGLISIGGNVGLMYVVAGKLRVPYLIANVITIACCALLNFLAADRWVFSKAGEPLSIR